MFLACELPGDDPADTELTDTELTDTELTDIELTDIESIAADKTALGIEYNGSDSADGVTLDVILTESGSNGTTISWSSSNTDIITNDGTVIRPYLSLGNISVILTATITKGNESDTVEIPLLVISNENLVVGEKISYTAGVDFNMVFIPGGIKFPLTTNDTDYDKSVDDDYFIGESEVTYQLWRVVYSWAITNGYTFINPGKEGHDGVIGAEAIGLEPVTTINWRESMIWMNAFTEYYNFENGTNLTPVYYTDPSYTTLQKEATDSTTTTEDNPGTQDNPYVKPNADGFRFLSNWEWEFAARYIEDSNNDGDILDAGEYYPGAHVSGADARYDVDTNASDFDNDGDIEYIYDVAVALDDDPETPTQTEEVKSKSPNKLGLYDMGGNVVEWVFNINGNKRYQRGGSYTSYTSKLQISDITVYNLPDLENAGMGFRIGRSY